MLRCLLVYVVTCFTCLLYSNIYMLSCLCTWYPHLSYFIIEKLNSKKCYIEEFRFYSEAYLEPTQTSMMKSSCETNPRLEVDNFFSQKSCFIDVRRCYKYASGILKLKTFFI